jgi:O-antigen ligase
MGGIARAIHGAYEKSEEILGRSWFVWALGLIVYAGIAYVLLNKVRLPSPVHLIVYAMAAAVLITTVMKVEWGLLGLVLMIPFARPGFTIGELKVFHVSGFNVAVVGVWLVYVIRYFADREFAEKGPFLRSSPVDAPAIIFLALAGVTSAVNLNLNPLASDQALILMGYKELIFYLAWFYLAYTLLRTPADVRRFILLLGVSGVLVAVIGLYARVTGAIEAAQVVTEAEEEFGVAGGRTGGVGEGGWFGLGHPNLFAAFLLMAMPFWFYAASHFKRLLQRAAGVFAILLGAVAILYTYARSAWGGIAISMTALALRDTRELRRMILFLILFAFVAQVMSVALIGAGVVEMMEARFEQLGRSGFSMRPEIYGAAVEVIRERPLLGVGMSAFRRHSPTPVLHAHNVFLSYASELGLPAVAAFIAFVGGMFVMAARNLRTSRVPGYGFIAQGTFVSLFAVLTLSMFDHIFFDRNVGHAFFALLAIIASYDRMVREGLLPGMEAAEDEPASALWTD